MEAEAIAIASLSTFRHGVVVVVGIAVEQQVIVAAGEIACLVSVTCTPTMSKPFGWRKLPFSQKHSRAGPLA